MYFGRILNSSMLKNASKQFGSYFIFDVVNKVLPFILLPILAKYLKTEEFGLLSNYLAFYQIAYIIISYATYTRLSTSYYKDTNHRELYSNLIFLILVLTLFVFLIVLVANPVIEVYFSVSLLWQIMAILSASFASVGNLYTTLLIMEKKSILYGIIQNSQSLLLFFFSIILVVLLPFNWKGRIVAQFISSFALFIVVTIYSKKDDLILSKFNLNRIINTIKWGIPLLPHNLSYWLKSGVDKIIVTSYLGLAINGTYSLALTIGSVMSLLTTSFFNIYTPYLFKKLNDYDNSDWNGRNKIMFSLKKFSVIFIFVYLFLSIIAYFGLLLIINYFFKGDYLMAIKFLPYILLANFFNSVYTLYSGYLFYGSKTITVGMVTVLSALIQLVLNLILVRYFGIYGILLSGIFSSLLMALGTVLFASRVYKGLISI